MRVTKQELKQAKAIIKEHKGKLYLSSRLTPGAAGEVNLATRCISVARRSLEDRQIFWSIILHEVGHLYCKDNNKYPIFHNMKLRPTAREKRGYVLTAWRAELYVDSWAREQLKEMYPELKYLGYDAKLHKQWLHENYLNHYKDQRFKKNRVGINEWY